MSLPSFLYDLMNEELFDMQRRLLCKVAEEYKLDKDELIHRILGDAKLRITPNTEVKVDIVRRQIKQTKVQQEEQCIARVWNRGRGGQCSRRANGDSSLCTHHMKEKQQHGSLRHGLITEEVPNKIFGTTNKKALYK